MVMFLVGCAMVAAWLITVAQLPQQLADMASPLIDQPRLLMLVIMSFAIGMVMDLAPIGLILVPLMIPIVHEAGINEVYFGLMFVINTSIGLITPPVGNGLNVVRGVSRVPMSQAVRDTAPFILAYLMLLGKFIALSGLIIVPMEFSSEIKGERNQIINFMKMGVLAAAVAISTPVAPQTVLKFAHPTPESDIQHLMAEFFAEKLEEPTNGEITVQIFPAGQLGSDVQALDGTRSGIIDFQLAGLNNYTGLVPEAGPLTLPFMFPERETAYKVLDGEVGQALGVKVEGLGLKMLGLPENGFRNMTNNRGPIVEPSDVSGLQMRINNSQALSDMRIRRSAG